MADKEKVIEEMISFGFSKEAAEKALKDSGGTTVDDVLEWIETTGSPETLNELSMRYGSKEIEVDNGTGAASGNFSKENDTDANKGATKKELTPDEIQEKVLALQKKIRQRKMQKEKEEAIEREKKRILTMKELQERKRQMEEQEKQMLIEARIREKYEHAKEKERQLEKFKLEYKERFGVEYKEEIKKKTIDQLSENEKREEIGILINSLKNKYKDKKKELVTSLNILKTYFTNIKNNILEKKYQSIRKENKVFSEKINIYDEMLQVMLLVGFVDSGEHYTLKGVPNTYLLSNAVRFIDLAIRNLD